jgi:hypothetical protein
MQSPFQRPPDRIRERVLLAVLLVPWLLLGSLVGGQTLWLHSHGQEGRHLHAADGVATLHGWDDQHHDEHAHGEEGEELRDHDCPRTGTPIRLPIAFLIGQRASSYQIPGPLELAPTEVLADGVSRGRTQRPPRSAEGAVPPGSGRSGVAALLTSSHAILL